MCIATNVVADSNEQHVIKCQADEGYFSIFIRGTYTQPVPYDCGPRYVNTDVYVYMCIHIYDCGPRCVYLCICTHVYVYIHIYSCECASYMYVYMYVYTYTP
jgi:hypothetical protein